MCNALNFFEIKGLYSPAKVQKIDFLITSEKHISI